MRDALEGIRDGLLFVPLYLPVAIPYTIAAKALGIADWQTVLWSALLFSGSSQLACLSALGSGAGLLELLIITFMANARHGFIAMGLARYYATVKHSLLPVLAFTISAPSLGLLPAKAHRGGNLCVYGLATQVCQWAQWVIFAFVGVRLGPLLPASWGPVIGFAVPAAFVGLLGPLVREELRSGLILVLVAAALSLGLTVFWPPQICAIVGALGGSVAALLAPKREGNGDAA